VLGVKVCALGMLIELLEALRSSESNAPMHDGFATGCRKASEHIGATRTWQTTDPRWQSGPLSMSASSFEHQNP